MASGYVGFFKQGKNWRVRLWLGQSRSYFGSYTSPELAAKAYDRAVYKLKGDSSGPNCGPLTDAEQREIDGWDEAALKSQPGNSSEAAKLASSSKYHGVCWDRGKWQSSARIDGKRKQLGRFDDEEEAARAYDQAVRALGKGKLNFPGIGEGPSAAAAGGADDSSEDGSISDDGGSSFDGDDGSSMDGDDQGYDTSSASSSSSDVSSVESDPEGAAVDAAWEQAMLFSSTHSLPTRYAANPASVTCPAEMQMLRNAGIIPADAPHSATASMGLSVRMSDPNWVPGPELYQETAVPEWRTEPWIRHNGRWTRIRAHDVFLDVMRECDDYIALERDFVDDTFIGGRQRAWSEDYAAWDARMMERKAEHLDNIVYALKRKMAIMRENGCEMNRPETLQAEALRLAAVKEELAALPPPPACSDRLTLRLGEMDGVNLGWLLAHQWGEPLPPRFQEPLRPPLQLIPAHLADVDAYGRLRPPAQPLTDEQFIACGTYDAGAALRLAMSTRIDEALAAVDAEFDSAPAEEVTDEYLLARYGTADSALAAQAALGNLLAKQEEFAEMKRRLIATGEKNVRWSLFKAARFQDEQKVIAMRCLADGQAPVEFWRSIRRNPPPFDAAELRRLQAMREAFEAQDVEPQRQETENIAAAAAARRTNAENILRLCDHAAADPTADQRALWSAIYQLGTQPA